MGAGGAGDAPEVWRIDGAAGIAEIRVVEGVEGFRAILYAERSVMLKFLNTPISKLVKPGPRIRLRPKLPYVYCAGTAKAAVLKYNPPGPYCW